MKSKLLPCDMESPFVFVSYCSVNHETVWGDVIHLQQHGLNLWIDEPNLDKRKDSWRQDALRAINNFNCELIIFYMSSDSLLSSACLDELREASSDATKATHNSRPVQIVVIEVERISNLNSYMDRVYSNINGMPVPSVQKGVLSCTLSGFREVFGSGNEKVRIQAKSSASSVSDFYGGVITELKKCQRGVYASVEKLYRNAVSCIVRKSYREATRLLLIGANNQYLPSILMLAHLLHTNNASGDCRYTSDQLWHLGCKIIPVENWKGMATQHANSKCYSEALAYALAYGEYLRDVHSLSAASKLWLFKKCLVEARWAMRSAQSIDPDKVATKARQLEKITQAELDKVPDTEAYIQ